MPVRFRGVSEYSSVYKWQPSFRSAQFQPLKEQLDPEAGLRSDQFNLLVEPNFSKKKQVPHRRPEAGNCLLWLQDDDAYENASEASEREVRSKHVVVAKEGSGDGRRETVASRSKKDASRSEKKESRRTEARRLDSPKCTWEKDKLSEVVQKVRKTAEASPKTYKSSPSKNETSVKPSASKEKKSPKKEIQPKISSKRNSPVKSEPKGSPKKSNIKSPEKKAKSNNVPFRYRPLHHRMLSAHQTEYQQMYKKHSRFVPASPLISALDVVHSTSPAIPPHKAPKMFSKSEYSSKFKDQSPLSKSVPNFSSPPSPSMRLKVRDLPTSPYIQRRSPQRNESEYANQYPAREYPTELSRKLFDEANHNKLNREGTAFDKDHVNQICSPKNKCWDLSSVTSGGSVATGRNSEYSRTCTAESFASGGGQRSAKLSSVTEETHDEEDIESVAVSEKDSLDNRGAASNDTLQQMPPVARRLAWGDDDDDDSTVKGSSDTASVVSVAYEGRLPTPQLKHMGGALRTHLDLTTPSPGGALLTSPSSSDKKRRALQTTRPFSSDLSIDEKPVKLSRSAPVPFKSDNEPVENERPTADGKVKEAPSEIARNKAAAPEITRHNRTTSEITRHRKTPEITRHKVTEGGDGRVLKQGAAKTSEAERTRKPEVPRMMQRTVRAPIQGTLRSQEFQHCGKNSRPSTAIDRISCASYASITSADDLLQRSLQRKDFWKTK